MPRAEHKRLRAPVCDLRATGRGVSFFYLSIILRPVRPPAWRLAGVEFASASFSRSPMGKEMGKEAGMGSYLVPAHRFVAARARFSSLRVCKDFLKNTPIDSDQCATTSGVY